MCLLCTKMHNKTQKKNSITVIGQCHHKSNTLAVPVEIAHGSPGFGRAQNEYHYIRQPEQRIVCGNNEEHDNCIIYQCLSVNIQ